MQFRKPGGSFRGLGSKGSKARRLRRVPFGWQGKLLVGKRLLPAQSCAGNVNISMMARCTCETVKNH